jgi:alginate O-acetyltransferase complex protein AlgI
MVSVFMLIEWIGRDQQYAIAQLGIKWKRHVRYASYYAIILAIVWFGGKQQQFVYFQF